MLRSSRSTAFLSFAALLAVAAASTPAQAIELTLPNGGRTIRLGITESLFTEYHLDTDPLEGNPGERYWDLRDRTDVVLIDGSTTLNARFDANVFFNTDEGTKHHNTFTLEKISLSSVNRAIELTAGDMYIRLGRGLALDFTRVGELSRDTTLRGGQAQLRYSWINAMAFGGWVNPLDLDGPTEVPVKVPDDVMYGGRIELRPLRLLTLAGHYVGSRLETTQAGQMNAAHIFGGGFELAGLSSFQLYAEFDYLRRDYVAAQPSGYGTYVAATSSLGPLALLAELKYYRAFQFDNAIGTEPGDVLIYNRPPTLSRSKQEVLNNQNVLSPRIRADLRWGSTVLFASYAWMFNSEPMIGAGFFDSGGPGHDIFAGVQRSLSVGALELGGGYRVEKAKAKSETTYQTRLKELFAEAEATVALTSGQSLDVQTEYRRLEKSLKSFSDYFITVGYRPSRYGAAALTYEYTTEYAGAVAPEGTSPRAHFSNLTCTINVTPTSYVRLFAGSTRGGSRCIDGLCRVLPPFVGAKIELVIQL